jgi:hypothetical protein
MERRHVKSHCDSAIHKQHVALKHSGRTYVSKPRQPESPALNDFNVEVNRSSGSFQHDADGGQYEPGDPSNESDSGQPAPILARIEDESIPLSELWDVRLHCDAYEISGGQDSFDEFKALLLGNVQFLRMPLAPLKDEMDSQDVDLEPDFGIKLLCQLSVLQVCLHY